MKQSRSKRSTTNKKQRSHGTSLFFQARENETKPKPTGHLPHSKHRGTSLLDSLSLYMYVSICYLLIYLSMYLSIYLCLSTHIYIYIHVSNYQSTYLSISLSLYLPLSLFSILSLCLSLASSLSLSLALSLNPASRFLLLYLCIFASLLLSLSMSLSRFCCPSYSWTFCIYEGGSCVPSGEPAPPWGSHWHPEAPSAVTTWQPRPSN